MRITRAATLLVHPDAIKRLGLRAALERHDRVRIVAESATGRDAVDLARRLRPELIVLEAALPGLNGADVAQSLLRWNRAVALLMLGVEADNALARELACQQKLTCLPSDYTVEQLSDAVDASLDNQAVGWRVSDESGAEVNSSAPQGVSKLTLRQREVMQMVSEGHSTQEIAQTLGIRPKTVHHHRRVLMRRLAIDGIANLTRLAIREGLSPLDIQAAS